MGTALIGGKTDAFIFATPIAAGTNFVACITLFASLTVPVIAITRLI